MSAFTCTTEIPDQSGLEKNDLTVGREFWLNCSGPFPAFAPDAVLKFELAKEEEHAIKLLEPKKITDTSFELKVTSYRTGPREFKNLILTDGQNKAELGPLQFEVRSVLDESQPQQEPYGPIGPLTLSIPLAWWLILFGIIAAIAATALFQLRRRWQKRRLLEKLREHDAALSPLAEFHQKLRLLKRDHELFAGLPATPDEAALVVQKLEKIFRVFFMRRFQLPALDWANRVLLREFRRENRDLFEAQGEPLRRLLREFLAAGTSKKVELRDAVQLTEQTRALAESLDRGAE